ncbi:MAG: hypothetical protein VX541_14080, partial [Candidatus Poribacteria bacterium]|nr:hypothetical protein [Candidatus Poribacteria bacterium]
MTIMVEFWHLRLVVTAITTNIGLIISRSASTPSSVTTISTGNRLEYLSMAIAQVTDNPAIADGSSIHQEA